MLSPTWARGLIVADFVAILGVGVLQGVGAVPQEIWVQYPLLILGGVLMGYLAKAHLNDQERWRSLLVEEQNKSRLFIQGMLQEERAILLDIIKSMQVGHDESMATVLHSQKDAYEEVIERVIESLAKRGLEHFERKQ